MKKAITFPPFKSKAFILEIIIKKSQKHSFSLGLERGLAEGWRVAADKAKWEVDCTGAIFHCNLERSLVVRVKKSEIAVLNAVLSCWLLDILNTFIIKFFKCPNYCLWRSTSFDIFGQFDVLSILGCSVSLERLTFSGILSKDVWSSCL